MSEPAVCGSDVLLSYVYDPSVTPDLDWELRVLLAGSFPEPVFRERRFNHELPAHRWILRAVDGSLIAHAAVHDKHIGAEGELLHVGGVAEVCVHPGHRGRGYVKLLLQQAHAWMAEQRMVFSILYGRPEVYRSSGYRSPGTPVRYYDVPNACWRTAASPVFLILPLTSRF